MEIRSINSEDKETLEHLLAAIPFFKAVKQQSLAQYEQLVRASHVASYKPSEVVLQKGEHDSRIFFLLKGRLAVYIDRPNNAELVNHITPGEVFGDIAQLLKLSRTATLVADESARETIVLTLDSVIFEPLTSFHTLTLATKLAYYRNMAHNFRWKLEVYRAQHLQHELANKHRQIKLFTGARDTIDELSALYEQSKALAVLLMEWNNEFASQDKTLTTL